MTERPRPDLNRVREALRDHDEREESAPDPPPTEEDATDEDDRITGESGG